MIRIETRDHRVAYLRLLTSNDMDRLTLYLKNLSDESKQRFGPHPFDRDAVELFLQNNPNATGFVATEADGSVVAYALIKKGFVDHDLPRMELYGIEPSADTDCTYAPSVADSWQSCGLGTHLFQYINRYCRDKGFRRMFLWGGVQCANMKAVHYYRKLGFKKLGNFENHGSNDDMMWLLND